MKQVKVTVLDGEVKLDLSGFANGECLKETEDLIQALGGIHHTTKKPEAFRQQTQSQQKEQKHGQ
jgi:hypothetical protein